MVDNKRPWRAACYYIKWNNETLYIHSRIATLLIYKEWTASALKQRGLHTIEFGGVAKPYMQKNIYALDIVNLLNGGWDYFLVSKTEVVDGVITKSYTDNRYKHAHNQCNKLRIKGVYFNNTMRKALSMVLANYDLVEMLFRVPSPNVFEAMIKLLPEGDLENKEMILKYARNIFYVMRKPYRKTK
jgi:hypothetical protein